MGANGAFTYIIMNTDAFIVSDKQIELDMKLVPYDLWASRVHVLMLGKQKIIKKPVCIKIIKGLDEIEKEYKKGKFSIDPSLGLHLTIEKCLIEKIGDDGYFMHTGRSRNDQVMTAELLYLREKMLVFLSKLLKLLKSFIDSAEEHIITIMPGYTHMQPAKPTTFGQWCLAYSDMLFQCVETLQHVLAKYNLNPLGSVESYGTSWPIDRLFTAKLLGFSKVWEIPQSAISSRGFVQLAYLGGLKDIAIVISKIASDLLLFTTYEYGYVLLGDMVAEQMGSVTGSSVMPQKKNPDVLELMRSISSQVIGFESIVANLLSGLPIGYNRDTREVKEYIELGFVKVMDAMETLSAVMKSMKLNKARMHKVVTENYSLATDLADYIAQKTGLPYRKVYKEVGETVKNKIKENIPLTSLDPAQAILKRKHIGGSNPQVMKKMIKERKKLLSLSHLWIESEKDKINKAKIMTQKEIWKL